MTEEQKPTQAVGKDGTTIQSNANTKLKILYLEDDDRFVERGIRELEKIVGKGNVDYYITPKDVPQDIDWVNPPYDLIVTDQTMPGMSGTAFARELRKSNQDIPIILTTANHLAVVKDNNPDFDALNVTHYYGKLGSIEPDLTKLVKETLGLPNSRQVGE